MTNVFEMYVKNGGPGFWVRRNNWGGTVARVIRVGKFTKPAPYYGNPSVLADFYRLGGELKDELAALPSPNTGAYTQIEPPHWAETSHLRALDDPKIDPALLALDKKRGKAFRPQKDTSHIEKVWLRVIYDRKDEAKALGAKWSPEEKKWWLPADNAEALEKARQKRFLTPEGEQS